MTTKTNITLPPLPGALVDVETEARAYARAAVEADRADHLRGVTNAGIMEIWRPYRHFPPGWICGFAHALLSRYSSGQPAAVRCNHCGWHGADADLVRDVAADEPDDGAADVCPRCKRIGDLQDIGQPAASAEPVAHTDDDAVDRFAAAMKTKLAQKRAEGRGGWEDKAQCSQDRLSLMLRGHVAKGDPVDVGNFCMMLHQRGERISGHDAASPSAQDREDDEALADTQRAIIEAAERRGYERAIAECAQVARAAKGE